MLDLYKLDIFLHVTRAGSFNRAAEGLLMSQSAVSQHIQDLEIGLGATLFDRGRRGVEMTQAGKTLHDYALRIFQLIADAENAVTDVSKLPKGQIMIGATPGVGVYLLPDAIQSFRQHYPNLSVILQTGITSHVIADLYAGRVDLGFIEGELEESRDQRLCVKVLEQVEQLVVVGRKHPWWDRNQVALQELNGQSFIMRQAGSQTRIWLEQTLRDHKIEPKVSGEFDNVESMKRMVTLGLCLAILPAYVVHEEVKADIVRTLPLQGAPLQRTLKLVWDREKFFTPVVWAFLKHLSTRLPALAGVIAEKRAASLLSN
jgi:DNA-binding transcriptional LysR family regulator